jgi:hypothetical protein
VKIDESEFTFYFKAAHKLDMLRQNKTTTAATATAT